ncbi:MAG: CBS domain-containing protein [Gemmataceae bacterium]|nr:CBS domain-containing protein [Gemmataceae bacterium]
MATPTTKRLLEWTARDLMTRHLLMVPQEMQIQGAARMLSRAQVTGAPVVDEQGKCVGVVSATDFLHLVEQDELPLRHREEIEAEGDANPQIPTVREVMTRDPVMVEERTPIARLAKMMLDARIHRAIVADAQQRPVGIVTTTDILAALSRADSGDGAA